MLPNKEGVPSTNTLIDVSSQLNVQKSFDRNELNKMCFNYVNQEQRRIHEFLNSVMSKNEKKGKAKSKDTAALTHPKQSIVSNYKAAAKASCCGTVKPATRNNSASHKSVKQKMNSSKDVWNFGVPRTMDVEPRMADRVKSSVAVTALNTSREVGAGFNKSRRSSSSGNKKGKSTAAKNPAMDRLLLLGKTKLIADCIKEQKAKQVKGMIVQKQSAKIHIK